MIVVNKDNFTVYAAHYYDNPNCTSDDEFFEDLERFKYLKKLFYQYQHKNVLRERLILNHLIVLYNVFENKACTKMLFLRLEDYLTFLIPFLQLLNYLPKKITDIKFENSVIYPHEIPVDEYIVQKLKEEIR